MTHDNYSGTPNDKQNIGVTPREAQTFTVGVQPVYAEVPKGYKPTNTVEVIAGAGKKYEQTTPTSRHFLLEQIDNAELGWFYGWMKDALRAVVELHKPDPDYETFCLECERPLMGQIGLSIEYPCPTIQAIEKELG
jgi:hypothetical protein